MEVQNDPLLQKAKKRVAFKKHLATYIIINAFLWAVWYFSGREGGGPWPWPVWSTLGWGVGLAFNYLSVYQMDKDDMVQREYDKLKDQQK